MKIDEIESKLDVVNFLCGSDDSDSEYELETDEHRLKNTNLEKCNEIFQMQIKSRLSNVDTAKAVDLMNSMPETSLKVPKNPMKYVVTNIDFQILFHCEKCDEIILGENTCDQCGSNFKKNSKRNNFMVYIRIEPQIRRLLNKRFDEIIQYSNREHHSDIISDIDDGELYKDI